MFRILFCMCWQAENKTCLVYVLGIAQRCMFQVRADCKKKKELESTKLDRSKIVEKKFLQNFKLGLAHENI